MNARFQILDKIKRAVERKKPLSEAASEETNLKRCFSTIDLIFIGVSLIGSGSYIIGGVVVQQAGPAAIISYCVASITALLSAFSYAEFGAKIPKAGSAYIFTYVSMGELWAFVIGWSVIQEYIITAASMASSVSGYIDSLSNGTISTFLTQHLPITSYNVFNPYPDILSFSIVFLFTVVVCFGIHKPALLNNFITLLCAFAAIFIFICCTFFSSFENWKLDKMTIPDPVTEGVGGFVPHGIAGIVKGAGSAFYSFVGFDVITIAGEESKTPKTSIPIALTVSILYSLIIHAAMVGVLTLMMPYYLVSIQAPFSYIFLHFGMATLSRITSVVVIVNLTGGLFTCMLGAPRVIYSMAADGLLMSFLARINQRFKTPIYANILSGLVIGVLTMLVKLEDLVALVSIGTLFAYSLISYCVLLLRYKQDPNNCGGEYEGIDDGTENEMSLIETENEKAKNKSYGTNNDKNIEENAERDHSKKENDGDSDDKKSENKKMKNLKKKKLSFHGVMYPISCRPTAQTEKIFIICMLCIVLITVISSLATMYGEDYLGFWGIVVVTLVSKAISVFFIFVIWRQPNDCPDLSFKVPLVPFVPIVGIIINIYLMIYMSWEKWVRIVVWTAVGILLYFCYGIHHSHLADQTSEKEDKEKIIDNDEIANNDN